MKPETRNCKYCGDPFITTRPNREYCCLEHQEQMHSAVSRAAAAEAKLEQARLLNAECERQRKEAWAKYGELREAVAAFLVTARCGIEDDGVPWIEVDHATLDRLKDVMENEAI